jgi:hypothetical protein
MISLIFAACVNAALEKCVVTQKLELPPSMTMDGCEKVRQMILSKQYSPIPLPPGFNKVDCENS